MSPAILILSFFFVCLFLCSESTVSITVFGKYMVAMEVASLKVC